MADTVVLMILDGWGISKTNAANAAYHAKTPALDKLMQEAPHAILQCAGEAVGLPEGQQGNSEVGHLNLGAGRVVYQDLMRINRDIATGTFGANPVIQDFLKALKARGGDLHLMGLLSDGGVHAHQDHLLALLDVAQSIGVPQVWIHCFLDGRDVPPSSGIDYVRSLEAHLAATGYGKIATVSGRYYAMDRDKRMERVEKAWQAIVNGSGEAARDAVEAVQASYDDGVTDEFMMPTVLMDEHQEPLARIHPQDGVFFFNFRADRARELSEALVLPTFSGFDRGNYEPVAMGTMTEYDAALTPLMPSAYPPEELHNTLGAWLAAKGKRQIRIAETEKYAHVTFFFNGGVEAPNPEEDRTLIPSPKVATYDMMPEMSAAQVADAVVHALDAKDYAFILVNFANPDMVGHTGKFEAAVQAMEAVDASVQRIVDAVNANEATMLICADHGNCERMQEEDGSPYTAHTTNPVPVILYRDEKMRQLNNGRLCDIAPTVLSLLDIDIPPDMSGTSLLTTEEEHDEHH